ncbi:MAG: hypothetical protein ACTSYC_11895 [Promethearchaeota archaeon]
MRNLEDFGGTLFHETAHAISGRGDVTHEFEMMLTKLLGEIIVKTLEKKSL